jgi:hypothetical protein
MDGRGQEIEKEEEKKACCTIQIQEQHWHVLLNVRGRIPAQTTNKRRLRFLVYRVHANKRIILSFLRELFIIRACTKLIASTMESFVCMYCNSSV